MFGFPPEIDLGTEWKKNATTLGNILLYPIGEMNANEYLMSSRDADETRERMYGVQLHTVLILMVAILSIDNIMKSIKLIRRNRKAFTGWCCLLMSIFSFNHAVLFVAFIFPNGVSCRKLLWNAMIGYVISLECSNLLLLYKAYCVVQRKYLIVLFGVLITLFAPALIYTDLVGGLATIEPYIGCTIILPFYKPWLVFAARTPVDLFLSAVFIRVIHHQYRTFGSEAWGRLLRDGIQTACLVVICNVFCTIILLTQAFGGCTNFIYMFDWLATVTLLVNSSYYMKRALAMSNKPKTEFILNIADIATAQTFSPDQSVPSTDKA
ncbi:hypothetical protein BDF22DRAFT_675820 [Syncephalis plumigaleata]|nr:hypothetical protein BDF22DRAFT_675820 [Syncephalis plumigaleata]